VTLDLSDEALIEQTLSGDRDAFGVIVRRYRRACIAQALAVLGDPAEAEDVAQEALVHAYEQLATCRQPSRFGPWVLTIVRHRALNRLRTIRRRRAVALDDSIVGAGEAPTRRVERLELRRALLLALNELSPVQREVVLLADLEQWSHLQISEALGISVLMSRRHLSDGRARLRSLLANADGVA
jgi:RNA polymerase sigma-70 factor (ECF subfamily)